MALTLHYDFLNNPSITGQTVGPDLSITRATNATMVDADGYIREVQSGEERCTGATWSENALLQSENFGTSWTEVELTETLNTAVAPDGTTTADGFKETVTNTSHRVEQGLGLLEGNSYTISVYMKADGTNYATVYSSGVGQGKYFDLANGTVLGDIGSTPDDAGIIDAGNGWYRCWINVVGSAAAEKLQIFLSDTGSRFSYAGDVNNGIFVWGGQVENVSGKTSVAPSTYIKTTTAAASSLSGTSTKGLLVEEARTNICRQSEDFSNAWTTTDAVVSTNATTAPDGSTTADRITDDSGGDGPKACDVRQNISSGIVDTESYAFSIFAKADQLSWMFLASELDSCYFDLSTGAVGTAGGGGVGYIEAFNDGWYRCTLIFSAVGSASLVLVRPADADGDISVDMDGTSSIFVWGAQVEAGAFPTSYIPTTTASVTRNADAVSTTNMGWINSAQGTMYAQYTLGLGLGSSANRIWQLWTDSNNRLSLLLEGSSLPVDPALYMVNGGTAQIGFLGSDAVNLTASDTAKTAAAWAENDVAIVTDGGTLASDASATIPTFTSLNLGSYNKTLTYLNGHIAEIRYYDERYDNGTLLLMSQGIFPTFGLSFVRDIVRDLVRDLVTDLVR